MEKELLCKYNLELKDDKEVYQFLCTIFPDLDIKDIKGSYLSFCLSLLCYICYPLSVSELVTTLGTYIGGTIARTRIVEMLKRGDLKSYEFHNAKDMNAQHAYYLSLAQKESLLSILPDFFKNADTKFRKTSGKVPMHDYGCGMSLLQIMLLKRPFVFQKEVNLTSSSAYMRKEKGSLCIDAVVTMTDTYDNYFIEQDMGTESIATLCSKLYSYEKYDLYRSSGALIYSCHVTMNYSKRDCYNKTQLTYLLNDMKEEMMEEIFDYYECSKDVLDEKKLRTLKDLMVTVGVAEIVERKNGGRGTVTASTRIKLLKGGGRFSLADFEEYVHTLSLGTNKYRVSEYNWEQKRKAIMKFRNMCELLCHLVHKKGMDRPEIKFIATGFPCIVYPTVLLSHCFDYLNGDIYKNGMVKAVLSKYFDDWDSFEYKPSGDSMYIENEGIIHLNHSYKSKSGIRVCVEHIGMDVSAFVRFYYFYYLRGFVKEPLYLVGVGSRSDILYMSNLFQYHVEYGITLPKSGVFISFMDEDNMNSLLVPCEKEDGGIMLIEVVSDSEEKRSRQLIEAYYKLPREVRTAMTEEERARALGIE